VKDEATPAAAPALDLATYDEIVQELRRRHKSMLLVVVGHPEKAGGHLDPIDLRCYGGQLAAVGMARYAEQALLGMMFDNTDDDDEEDD
jgi:hypothetical protein